MSKLNLKTMLIGVMASLGLMIAVQGIVSMRSASAMFDDTTDLATNWMPSMAAASPVLTDVLRYRVALTQHILSKDAPTMAAVESRMAQVVERTEKDLKTYEANISEPEEKIAYPKIQAIWAQMKTMTDASVAASRAGDKAEAERLRQPQANMVDEVDALIQTVLAANKRGADGSFAASTAKYNFVFWLSLTVLAIGVAVFVAGIVIVTRRLLRPMTEMTNAMTVLAQGNLFIPVPHVGRTDEVGQMASAIQVFKDNAVRVQALEADEKLGIAEKQRRAEAMAAIVEEVGVVVNAAAQGNFSSRVKAQAEDPQLRQLVTSINQINQVVDRATGEFSSVLGALAEGDLTQAVTSDYQGRLAELKDAINNTISKLSETVVTIQVTANEVASSAREINAGADDLSRRTEGQAASLEETASTTEELAASVKMSANSSTQSVTLADDALKVAENGGSIVRDAVTAMQRIDQGSKKISDIISVIDSIAFQTNLLALNAAVEAARAGDAGKGFAVVASEVRTLAQRSSEAARDISALIHTSGSEVAEGVKLVRAAGDALDKIMDASRKVSATVSEIATASSEQAHGIDEMSQAVAHMDEMTQQNAALSEQSAASATALNGQIQRLNALVATFKTGQSSGAALRHDIAPKKDEPKPHLLQKLAKAAFGGKPTVSPTKPVAVRKTANGSDAWEEF